MSQQSEGASRPLERDQVENASPVTVLYFGDKIIGDWIDVPAVAIDDLRFPLFIEAAVE